MKKSGFLFLAASALLPSCSNELDIAADYKETTIVYGLLNQADSVHLIQVFRGFLDENISALTLAQNPDSLYYDDSVEVKINDGSRDIVLDKIIAQNRDEGIFVDSPNYAYQIPGSLDENVVYNLTITNKRTGHIVTAQTPIVKDFTVLRPSESIEINLASKYPNDIVWLEAENGKVYQVTMRFFYKEWKLTSPLDTSRLFIDWLIFNNDTSHTHSRKFEGVDFLSFLGTQLEKDPNVNRKASDLPLDFMFYVGAAVLYDYIRVNGAQTGITSLQVKPEYTNVNNGLGILSSRFNKTVEGIKLSEASFDSLSCGRYTKDLNFIDSPDCD